MSDVRGFALASGAMARRTGHPGRPRPRAHPGGPSQPTGPRPGIGPPRPADGAARDGSVTPPPARRPAGCSEQRSLGALLTSALLSCHSSGQATHVRTVSLCHGWMRTHEEIGEGVGREGPFPGRKSARPTARRRHVAAAPLGVWGCVTARERQKGSRLPLSTASWAEIRMRSLRGGAQRGAAVASCSGDLCARAPPLSQSGTESGTARGDARGCGRGGCSRGPCGPSLCPSGPCCSYRRLWRCCSCLAVQWTFWECAGSSLRNSRGAPASRAENAINTQRRRVRKWNDSGERKAWSPRTSLLLFLSLSSLREPANTKIHYEQYT